MNAQMQRSVALCIAIAFGSAHALEVPKSSTYDARVRSITYNPADVVQIETVPGVATHIEVEEGERFITHAFGDAEAWKFMHEGRHYFIKASAENADTNLTIVTNKRTYYFTLRLAPAKKAAVMYGVSFVYPESIAKQVEAAAKKAAVAQRLGERRGGQNWEYSMSGDLDIAPVEAYDNGEFTYFRIAGNRDAPGFFMVDADGQESIVNRNTVGASNDVVVLHKVTSKWIVRLGNRALAIWNDAYNPDGVNNTTGTASPSVTRVVKGAE